MDAQTLADLLEKGEGGWQFREVVADKLRDQMKRIQAMQAETDRLMEIVRKCKEEQTDDVE